MNPQDALRFAAAEAQDCRSKDQHEALCVLLPILAHALDLKPMGEIEARAYRHWLKRQLDQKPRLHHAA